MAQKASGRGPASPGISAVPTRAAPSPHKTSDYVAALALHTAGAAHQAGSLHPEWVGKCLDLSLAYKQVSIHPDHRDLAVVWYRCENQQEPSARHATGVPGVPRYLSKDLPKTQRSSSKRKSYSSHYTLRIE